MRIRFSSNVYTSIDLSYEQGPKEVQQPAKPSWKVYFQAFIANLVNANLKLPWDTYHAAAQSTTACEAYVHLVYNYHCELYHYEFSVFLRTIIQ